MCAAAVALLLSSCSGGGDGTTVDGTLDDTVDVSSSAVIVTNARAAATAVEVELGGPQEFFEITTTPQLTNVFVVADGGTTAIPFTYVDGELQPPAPAIVGVTGQSFSVDALDFDDDTVLSGIATDLPSGTIDAFSIEGGAGGFVRYVVSVRSAQGGVLDVVVAPSGAVVEVNPL